MRPELSFGILSFIIAILGLSIVVLVIYLLISVIKFCKNKTQNDKELLEKLDILINLMSKVNGNKQQEVIGSYSD